MKIILDIMGGDNSPLQIARGAVAAAEECGASFILVGSKEAYDKALDGCKYGHRFEHVPVDDFISMEDNPMDIIKRKTCSMAVALNLLSSGKGDACVSCGNTGALFTGATLILKKIHGIRRAALGTVLPYRSNVLLMDCGANVNVTAEYLLQFARLGTIYMNKLYGLERPRVALINNGAEEHKGTQLQLEARKLFEEEKNINFIGNVEGKDLPFNACDIAVCDGFTGNVILKTSEGLSRYAMEMMKENFSHIPEGESENVKRLVSGMDRYFDVTEYGGAPFIGISKPVIKAHGNSDTNAVKNAILRALSYAESDVISEITAAAPGFAPILRVGGGNG